MNKLILISLILYSTQCLGNVSPYRRILFPKDSDQESEETNARTALNNYNFEEQERPNCGHCHEQHERQNHHTNVNFQHDPVVRRIFNIPYQNGAQYPHTNILIPQDYYHRLDYNSEPTNDAVPATNGVNESYASPHDNDDKNDYSSVGNDDSNTMIYLRTVFVAPKNCKRMTASGRCLS